MAGKEQFDAAGVAIFRDGDVLLIKRARTPYKGYWTLPGGRIEAGETAAACARREIAEELGVAISPLFVAPHEVLHGDGTFALAVFVAEIVGETVTPNTEIAAWDWVAPDNFARLKTTPDLTRIVAEASRVITPA